MRAQTFLLLTLQLYIYRLVMQFVSQFTLLPSAGYEEVAKGLGITFSPTHHRSPQDFIEIC
jgi:hypothetical protein